MRDARAGGQADPGRSASAKRRSGSHSRAMKAVAAVSSRGRAAADGVVETAVAAPVQPGLRRPLAGPLLPRSRPPRGTGSDRRASPISARFRASSQHPKVPVPGGVGTHHRRRPSGSGHGVTRGASSGGSTRPGRPEGADVRPRRLRQPPRGHRRHRRSDRRPAARPGRRRGRAPGIRGSGRCLVRRLRRRRRRLHVPLAQGRHALRPAEPRPARLTAHLAVQQRPCGYGHDRQGRAGCPRGERASRVRRAA